MSKKLVEAVEGLMEEYYGEDVDWRMVLESEAVALEARVTPENAEITRVEFVDGVWQVAAPRPFNPLRCAWALLHAMEASNRRGGTNDAA